MNPNEPPALLYARARNDELEETDLRARIPKFVMGVIDAHWMSRSDAKASRNQVVNEILGEWAQRKWHEASLIARLAPANPQDGDSEASHG